MYGIVGNVTGVWLQIPRKIYNEKKLANIYQSYI